MDFGIGFILKSILLGVGLAMDAFSVSMANGLNEPKMKKSQMTLIAFTFGFFQFIMPLIGWFLVTTAVRYFAVFERFIPWIAMILLGYIGGKMLIEGIKSNGIEESEATSLAFGTLILQGVATSIDALSVGFTISDYKSQMALVASLIIAVTTFFISLAGVKIGKVFGLKLSGKASILGGVILIFIGLEILVKSFL